jgi:RHS repeat-associated protein
VVDNTGTTTLTYDACGSQRTQQVPSGGITTNTWDFENRLTKVALPTGVLNTFTYNGDGQRVQWQDSSGTLKAIWDGEKILEETDQNNVVQAVYTQSDGQYGDVVSQRRSGVSRYFLFDPLGSTSRLTDGSQNVTDSYLFKGFGESLLAAGPTTNPFQFVGRLGYYVDADLASDFARARELAPGIGRWTTADPLGFGAGDANLSRYVLNNPVTRSDPSGMQGGATVTCLYEYNGMVSSMIVPDCPGKTAWECCVDAVTTWYGRQWGTVLAAGTTPAPAPPPPPVRPLSVGSNWRSSLAPG